MTKVDKETKNKKPLDTTAALMGAGIAMVAIIVLAVLVFGATSLARGNSNKQMGPGGQGIGMNMQGERGGMRGQRPTAGEVQSVSDKSITIKSRDDETITVTVSDSTKYNQDREDSTFDSIKTGDTIIVMGEVSENTVAATRIIINPSFTPGM